MTCNTYQDGQVVHLISSGERDRYYLCEDSVIANEGSAGAADSMYCYYELSGNTDELSLIEQVRYYGIETPDTPWYYGTTNTIDISEMVTDCRSGGNEYHRAIYTYTP